MRMKPLLVLAPMLALAACSSTPVKPRQAQASVPPAPHVGKAAAALAPASGSLVSGRVVFVPMTDGVHLTGTVGGLAPGGRFGFHIHEKGDCSAVDASSAGGHFNPTGAPHGRAEAGPHHAGDMDNLVAGPDGTANVDVRLIGTTLGGSAVTNIVGRALVVHGGTDDYTSQPAGNAGARVACGVIKPAM